MANEEPTYAVKVGNAWHVRRVRDNMTLGYVFDDLVQLIPIGGNLLQGVDKKGKVYLYNHRGCFLRNVY